jgi:TonB family protein
MRRAVLHALAALALLLPSPARAADESTEDATQRAAERAGAATTEARAPLSIDASELSKQPKLVKQAKVSYPQQAIGKAGDVEIVLAVDLDEKGSVTGAAVIEPKEPTGLGFEEEALTAAYDLGFEPAEAAGKPTPVQIIYKFKFLAPRPPQPPAPEPIDGGAPNSADAGPPAPKPVPVENFTGKLVERGTRLPLSGILVTVYRTEADGGAPVGFENNTDEKGVFHFYDLTPGEWKVRIEPPSYYPFRTTEEIRPGERVDATYYLERGSYNPFDVVVEAKRERKEVSRTVIEAAVIEKVPGAMGDALAVIQNFAGVARAEAGSGYIMVRGSAPYDTAYFFDGTFVPIVYHFGGIRSVMPTGMMDSLQFYPGNFSPYYSWVTGGIIDVDIKKLKPKKIGGYADVNLLDGGFYLEVPLGKKAAIAIAARRSYIDYIINAVLPSDIPVNALTLPRYYDFQLLANYRPAPAHDLRLFLFGSDDRFEIILKNPIAGTELSGNQILFSTTFYRALATYRYVPSDRLENTLRLSQGRDIQDTQVFNWTMDYTTDFTHLRDTLRYQAAKSVTLVGGVDIIYARVSGLFNIPAPPQEGQAIDTYDLTAVLHEEINGANYYIPGAFVELEWKPIPGLLVLPGVRLDYYSEVSQFTAAPRFTTRYELGKQLTLKGGVGLFYQQPSIDQADKVFGSTHLKCMRAIHYSAGAEWKPWKHITLDLTGFYKDIGKMVSANPARQVDTSAERYDNNGKGRAYGLEFVAKHDLTQKFTGWLAYTLMRSERKDSGSDTWRLFQYDQTHILTILGTYRLPRNWQIGSRFRFVTGNPTTPVAGAVFDASNGDRYYPSFGPQYSSRIPAFHQLDIRIDKLWVYNKWMFNAYVDLQNVYNRSNPEAMEYNYNYQRSTVRQGFPIYPIIGLRGEF